MRKYGAATLALGQIRPVAVGISQKLMVGLGDPDRELKAAFLTAIGILGDWRGRESVPAVRSYCKTRQQKCAVRRSKSWLTRPRRYRLADDLTALVNDVDSGVQRRAIDTLRSLGPLGKRALPDVIAKLESKQTEVRLAAAHDWQSR